MTVEERARNIYTAFHGAPKYADVIKIIELHVAADRKATIEDERGACLEIVMDWFHPTTHGLMPDQDLISTVAAKMARKIRARSDVKP